MVALLAHASAKVLLCWHSVHQLSYPDSVGGFCAASSTSHKINALLRHQLLRNPHSSHVTSRLLALNKTSSAAPSSNPTNRPWAKVQVTISLKYLLRIGTRAGMASSSESSIELQRAFLAAKQFAVVGASKDQTKYGTRVLKWYQTRDLPVTPVHPKEAELEGLNTIKTLNELSAPSETSVSIITPPKVTLSILETAKNINVPYLWLQPGAEDEAVRKYVEEAGLTDKVILGGPCVLRDGDELRESASKL